MKKVQLELIIEDAITHETLMNTMQNGSYTILSSTPIDTPNTHFDSSRDTMYQIYMEDNNRYNALLTLQNTLQEEHSTYKTYITLRNNYLTNLPLEYNKDVEMMLENVLEVYNYNDILQHIVSYLTPLPQHIVYEKLQLSQNILRHYLHIDALFRSPKSIESLLMHEFSNYQKLYKKHYTADYKTYATDYTALIKDLEHTDKRLSASYAMSQIPILDEKKALDTLQLKLQHFKKSIPERFYSVLEIQEELNIEPYIDDFTLNKQAPKELFTSLNTELLDILHRQYSTINRVSKQSLLHNHEASDVSKLLDMMRLSDKNRFIEVIQNIADDAELMHILELLLSKKPLT